MQAFLTFTVMRGRYVR